MKTLNQNVLTINADHDISNTVACVASVSSRGSSRKLGQEQKEKNEWRGRGRGTKEPLARKPHDFEKLRSPTNAASDWHGTGSVDYLAFETSIKPGMLCFRASQIWSHLFCGRRLQMLWTDIYWNHVCAKVYEIINNNNNNNNNEDLYRIALQCKSTVIKGVLS